MSQSSFLALIPFQRSRLGSPVRHIHYFDSVPVSGGEILPNEYYVTDEDIMISTVLGSCINAAVTVPSPGVGGMNHFMLPGGNAVAPASVKVP